MRIIENEDGTYSFVPTLDSERSIVDSIIKVADECDTFDYDGRQGDFPSPDFCLLFSFGGERRNQTIAKGSATVVEEVTVGGIQIAIWGDDEESRSALAGVRDVIFFGRFGLIFLRAEDVDGTQAMICTTTLCIQCGKPATERVAAVWGICDNCAENCDHDYRRGTVQGGGHHIAMGDHCSKCGRTTPETAERLKEMTSLEAAVEVSTETGAVVMDRVTAEEVVKKVEDLFSEQ